MNRMNILISFAAAFLAGAIGAMGFGGGAVLIIFLTLFEKINQFTAQGINLLFFIPVALTATAINAKKGKIDYTTVLPLCVGGMAGAGIGFFAAGTVGVKAVARLFGGAILLLGVKEIVNGVKTMLASRRGR